MKLCRVLPLLILLLWARSAWAVPVVLRVTDADNKPIAGAAVSYLDYANWRAGAIQSPTEARTAEDGSVSLDLAGATTQTDADGFESRDAPNDALGAARVRAPNYGLKNVLLVIGENSVRLSAATQLSGVIQDEKGAAVAGARVELVKVEKDANNYDDLAASAGFSPVVATTARDGKWEFEGVSRGYAALLVSAPGYVAAELDVWINGANVAAPPLKLERAGTVKGRILDADGGVVPDVSVGFSGHMDEGVKSDGAGHFVLSGVPVGESQLSFWSSRSDWLGVDGEINVTVPAPDAVADVGDVREGTGVLVSGAMRDLDGAPLANFPFKVGGANFRTDAAGRFAGHVEKQSYFSGLPADWVMVTRSPYIDSDAKAVDAGEITIGRGARLPLDVRDENGRAAPCADLFFSSKIRGGNAVFDGKSVRSTPLLPGDYEVKGRALWQVIEPKTVHVAMPQAGEHAAPLQIVVRKLTPTRVSGRVVNERGEPLEGARIDVLLSDFGSRDVVSRADGTWQFEFDAHGEVFPLRDIKLEGYKLLRGGEWTHQNDAEFDDWKAADIVLSRLDATLRGRVLDAKGAPAVDARVSWAGAPDAQAVAPDAGGNFEIAGLPDAPLPIRASDGPSFLEVTATLGEPLTLPLPATAPLSPAELEALWEKTSAGEVPRLWSYFEVLGARRVFEATKRFDFGRSPLEVGGLYNYLDILAQRAQTPLARADAAREGVALLARFPIEKIGGLGAARIALWAALSDDDAELREWAGLWYDAQKRHLSLDHTYAYAVDETLRVAAIGAALGRADASDYQAMGLLLIERLQDANRKYYYANWGALLWQGGPDWFDEGINSWSPAEQMSAVVGALDQVRDVEQARTLLARLQNLAARPEVMASEAEELKRAPSFQSTRQTRLQEGAYNFVMSVAPLDASAALSVLEGGDNARNSDLIFAVARAAIASGQNEIARRALRLGLQNEYAEPRTASALALLAREFDADLAAELLEFARGRALAENSADKRRDVADYAFALREFDAGRGRLLLEEQWALQHADPRPPGYNWGRTSDLQDLA